MPAPTEGIHDDVSLESFDSGFSSIHMSTWRTQTARTQTAPILNRCSPPESSRISHSTGASPTRFFFLSCSSYQLPGGDSWELILDDINETNNNNNNNQSDEEIRDTVNRTEEGYLPTNIRASLIEAAQDRTLQLGMPVYSSFEGIIHPILSKTKRANNNS